MQKSMKLCKRKWLNVEEETHVSVIPDTDIEPHGTKISDTEYELTVKCACNPKVIAGEKGQIYDKPIVVHNSFEDMKKIDEAMKNI